MDRRAYYNLLKMEWSDDPTTRVEQWQVQNYRSLAIDKLFFELQQLGFELDRPRFIAMTENLDNPEELVDLLFNNQAKDPVLYDRVYLLIFEIWRKLVPEKLSRSIFCDELDYQIELYRNGTKEDNEELEDVLTNLLVILDENLDEGMKAKEILQTINEGCAHDIESFLYDFIADQIDQHHEPYAQELVEGFSPYSNDKKWFDLLEARLLMHSEPNSGLSAMQELVKQNLKLNDLEYNLELLSSLIENPNKELFFKVLEKSVPLFTKEDEFKDLLSICSDYFYYLDQTQEQRSIHEIAKQRNQISPNAPFDRSNPHVKQLFDVLNTR